MRKRSNTVCRVLTAGALLTAALALVARTGRAAAAKPARTAKPAPAASAKPAAGDDEKAIRATADAFVKAFDAGDAKAVGALWAPDAEYTDESGQSIRGRAAIEKEYADLFKEHPGATMTVAIESIRFLGPDSAVEKGVAKVSVPNAEATTAARYTVIHAKRNGRWVMVVARDDRYVPETNADYLSGLAWLIGDWTLDSKDRSLKIHFEWMAQKNFIRNTFTATKDGQAALTGGQIIGWNPRLGQIVSWHFGANGGFGNGVWTRDGSKWVIDASSIARDGAEGASVNILTPIDANSFTWQSIRRTVDGVELPDVPPVKVVRVQSGK
jgi:uncharacterized protein (TIGR02246 family)